MSFYRVTNITDMSIVIEDMNVRLPCKGSSMVIDATVVNRSKDLKAHSNWVKIEPIPQPKPMPIWPLTKQSPQVKNEVSTSVAPVVQSELSEVRKSLQQIEQSTKVIMDLMASKSLVPELQPQFKDTQSISQTSQSDPIFFPKTMLPKDAEVSISTEKGEKTLNLDAVTAALRNARKR